LALQAALDRAGVLAREIDGRPGAVTKRALAMFQKEHGLTSTVKWTEIVAALGVNPGKPEETITNYSIAAEDVEGPFTTEIPKDMEAKAELQRLGTRGSSRRLQTIPRGTGAAEERSIRCEVRG
jgi:peptidoglycan hydrolase-like protein with peptidoglycan-binding domain